MGVQGLLPFLKAISKSVSLSDLRGCTVGVDTYCWLHKAAICCSDKIALSQDTDLYLNYCLKYVNLLLSYNIKVILVFDGRNLPAKKDVEDKRRANRDINMKKAVQLVMEKKNSEAKGFFDRCINITHDMAVKFIKKAHTLGVKCIVAPYEADAQLAFLGKNNLVDYIITDDSDLLLFGTPKVLFKLDFSGKGVLIEKKDLNKVLNLSLERYSFDKFRYICIISGCDYYAGIGGVGLITANKMVKKTQLTSLAEFLQRINLYSSSKIILSKEEIQKALEAELTLKHQIVFDPIKRKQVPLTEYPVGMSASDFIFAGQAIEDERVVLELACGKRYPKSQEIVQNFNCDRILQANEQTFHWGLIRSKKHVPLERRKTMDVTINRNKSMVVRCGFPWKSVSSASDVSMMDVFESYQVIENGDASEGGVEETVSTHSDESDEAVNILKMVLSKDESIITAPSLSESTSNPFSKKGVMRPKRANPVDRGKENQSLEDIADTKRSKIGSEENVVESVLTAKKLVATTKLSHLFRK